MELTQFLDPNAFPSFMGMVRFPKEVFSIEESPLFTTAVVQIWTYIAIYLVIGSCSSSYKDEPNRIKDDDFVVFAMKYEWVVITSGFNFLCKFITFFMLIGDVGKFLGLAQLIIVIFLALRLSLSIGSGTLSKYKKSLVVAGFWLTPLRVPLGIAIILQGSILQRILESQRIMGLRFYKNGPLGGAKK